MDIIKLGQTFGLRVLDQFSLVINENMLFRKLT